MRYLVSLLSIIALIGTLFGAHPAAAQVPTPVPTAVPREEPEPTEVPEPTEAPEVESTQPVSGTNPLLQIIASYFNVPLEEVQDLRSTEGIVGLGNIARTYFMAQATGTSVSDIVAMRQSGLGWGQIAKQLGVHPSINGRSMGKIRGGEKGPEGGPPGLAKEKPGRPDHAGPPDHAGKPDKPGKPADTPGGPGNNGRGRNKP
ncbi:MAG: hypothetical protein KatS3mg057_0513 [Herpetosiphonaceae bacterium]|nr:MAG: hypothetical protein KatS3mg057_0513 [Herpetosiphonaceae bacterium]